MVGKGSTCAACCVMASSAVPSGIAIRSTNADDFGTFGLEKEVRMRCGCSDGVASEVRWLTDNDSQPHAEHRNIAISNRSNINTFPPFSLFVGGEHLGLKNEDRKSTYVGQNGNS